MNASQVNKVVIVLIMVRVDGKKLSVMIIFKESKGIIPIRVHNGLQISNCFIKASSAPYIASEILRLLSISFS